MHRLKKRATSFIDGIVDNHKHPVWREERRERTKGVIYIPVIVVEYIRTRGSEGCTVPGIRRRREEN